MRAKGKQPLASDVSHTEATERRATHHASTARNPTHNSDMNSVSIARTANTARVAGKAVQSRQRRARAVVSKRFGTKTTTLGGRSVRVNAEGTSSNLDAILGITAEKEEEEEVVVEAKTETVAAPDVESNAVPDVAPISATEGYAKLAAELDAISQLPPSERGEAAENATGTVRAVLNGMKAAGETNRWDCYPELTRKNVFPNELNQVGVKNSDQIGAPNNTNDFNFIVGVTMSTSLLALIVGVTLPGDWGAFGSYLIGGISLAVLAVGSTAPGLLVVAIDRFARISPEYRNRIARHEAAHFLVGYMLGTPVAGYSLGLGTAHVDFQQAKLERKVDGNISISEQTMLPLACMSMAGVAAEAMAFEDVRGQEGDLRDLQRLLNRADPKLSAQAQQQLTRWAVWQSAGMLKRHEKAFDALTRAMEEGATVAECLRAIEAAPKPE